MRRFLAALWAGLAMLTLGAGLTFLSVSGLGVYLNAVASGSFRDSAPTHLQVGLFILALVTLLFLSARLAAMAGEAAWSARVSPLRRPETAGTRLPVRLLWAAAAYIAGTAAGIGYVMGVALVFLQIPHGTRWESAAMGVGLFLIAGAPTLGVAVVRAVARAAFPPGGGGTPPVPDPGPASPGRPDPALAAAAP